MGITTNRPVARCLDLTRLLSRAGRGPWTGIDRVEYEYFCALDAEDIPLFAIAKFNSGYFVFDPVGCNELLSLVSDHRTNLAKQKKWREKWNSFRQRRVLRYFQKKLAQTFIRKGQLNAKLSEILPSGTIFLNVGHSNISQETFDAFRRISQSRITVMIHDTIPLDFPQFQRPESVPKFLKKFHTILRNADLVICNSAQTKSDVIRNTGMSSKLPEFVVVHLGARMQEAKVHRLPNDCIPAKPYFVTLGTIEPRKNHTLLLDIWARFSHDGEDQTLYVVGQRGWNNRAVFDRLDKRQKSVVELNSLSDAEVAGLLLNSNGLLFPSYAEGFGMPVLEAAQLGIPVICNDLPVYREYLGEYPIYADVSDLYNWETKIRKLANSGESHNNGEYRLRQESSLPTWEDHFNQVLRLT